MMVAHLTAAARGTTRLVLDDRDRFDLIGRVVAAFGDRLLAHCLMDTHVHVVVEGPDPAAPLAAGLRGYARSFNARHREETVLLRGPVVAIAAPGEVELARMIHYVHENPLKTKVAIVKRQADYEWSSARAFAGLSRARFPNAARARELLARVRWFKTDRVALAGLEAVPVPSASPGLILAAAAQALGVDPVEVAGPRRAPELVSARGVYMSLGRLESYSDRQLAPFVGRSRQQASALGSGAVDGEAVRIARTLLREPRFRARLACPARETP